VREWKWSECWMRVKCHKFHRRNTIPDELCLMVIRQKDIPDPDPLHKHTLTHLFAAVGRWKV